MYETALVRLWTGMQDLDPWEKEKIIWSVKLPQLAAGYLPFPGEWTSQSKWSRWRKTTVQGLRPRQSSEARLLPAACLRGAPSRLGLHGGPRAGRGWGASRKSGRTEPPGGSRAELEAAWRGIRRQWSSANRGESACDAEESLGRGEDARDSEGEPLQGWGRPRQWGESLRGSRGKLM